MRVRCPLSRHLLSLPKLGVPRNDEHLPSLMGDVPLTHLGQGPAAGTAPFQRDFFFLKKEMKSLSLKGRVRTRWFGGFLTTTTSRMAFPREHPKDGAVCTEFVTTQPPSCCSAVNGVLVTYFPPPRALSRGQWVCGSRQTPRMLLVEGKEHLPHALGSSTSPGSPAGVLPLLSTL